MNKLAQYTATTINWRRQLQINERRSKFVIGVFVLIYVVIGLIIDLYLHPELDKFSISQAIWFLLTFKVVPVATLLLGGVATVSVLLTYAWYDRIMLLGTKCHEITADKQCSLIEQQLYNVIEELKIAAGIRYMPKIYLIEADYMNAFASGYSEKSALVAITRGLLNKLERSELQAVMAHELSHIRHHDIKLTLMASVLSNIVLIAIDIVFRGIIFGGRGRRRNGGGLVIIIFLLRFLLPLITVLLLLYLSRRREFMADAGAVELMRDNGPLAKALLKINDDHRDNKEKCQEAYGTTPHEEVRQAAYIFDPKQMGISLRQSIGEIFSTHPSIDSRLQALGFYNKKNNVENSGN